MAHDSGALREEQSADQQILKDLGWETLGEYFLEKFGTTKVGLFDPANVDQYFEQERIRQQGGVPLPINSPLVRFMLKGDEPKPKKPVFTKPKRDEYALGWQLYKKRFDPKTFNKKEEVRHFDAANDNMEVPIVVFPANDNNFLQQDGYFPKENLEDVLTHNQVPFISQSYEGRRLEYRVSSRQNTYTQARMNYNNMGSVNSTFNGRYGGTRGRPSNDAISLEAWRAGRNYYHKY